MTGLQPLDPLVGSTATDVAEKERFFGTGAVLDYYRRAWDYRPGERYVFDRFLGPGGNLLDIGCGTGRTSFLLADRFAEVHAFDIVSEMIEVARFRNEELGAGVNFFVADAKDIPVVSGRFDAALFSYNGIEGILDAAGRRKVLSEVRRALRPGGHFVFTTKSCFNLAYWKRFYLPRLLARCGIGAFDGRGPLDVLIGEGAQTVRWRTSSPFSVRAALRRAGFEVLYFNSEVALGRGETVPRFRSNFHRWDHFFACRKVS